MKTSKRKPLNDAIRIRGARVHNLKSVSLDIPHEKLTVVTGVSGSGKSSLAFDTIYAEGQRRYVESLSAYARQFLERMEKPDVDEIEGIAPPVAIRQKNTTKNPRSTVATTTELYDFLRLLWARAGRTYCPSCGTHVERDTVDQVAKRLSTLPLGSRWYALFALPVEKHKEGSETLRERLFDLRKRGFTRLYQNNQVFEFSTPESLLDVNFTKPVFVLVDRLAIGDNMRQRIVDTLEICYREAGEALFEPAGGGEPLRFNERFECKTCGKTFVEPEPGLFSFNNPQGACKRCQGFGNTIDYDMDLIVPNRSLSIQEGAVDPWTKPQHTWYLTEFRRDQKGKIRFTAPVGELKPEEQAILRAAIYDYFKEVEKKKYKVHVRVFLSRYRGYTL
ncbi:MAG: excinuclease ABC subunit A, partial [Acidobacteriota bacterium]